MASICSGDRTQGRVDAVLDVLCKARQRREASGAEPAEHTDCGRTDQVDQGEPTDAAHGEEGLGPGERHEREVAACSRHQRRQERVTSEVVPVRDLQGEHGTRGRGLEHSGHPCRGAGDQEQAALTSESGGEPRWRFEPMAVPM